MQQLRAPTPVTRLINLNDNAPCYIPCIGNDELSPEHLGIFASHLARPLILAVEGEPSLMEKIHFSLKALTGANVKGARLISLYDDRSKC